MDDVLNGVVGADHRRVDRRPPALLERAIRPPHIVLLDGHRVGLARRDRARDRRGQVARARRLRVGRVVGKHVEQATPDDGLAVGHRRAQVRVARGEDRQRGIRREHQVQTRRCLEQRSEVERYHPGQYYRRSTPGKGRAWLRDHMPRRRGPVGLTRRACHGARRG